MEDLKGTEAWRIFRIMSEFTEGFDSSSTCPFPSPSSGLPAVSPEAAITMIRNYWLKSWQQRVLL